jgi:menaquinone-9 beta-reductase
VAQALVGYGDFSAAHRWKFEAMLGVQRAVPRVAPRLLTRALGVMQSRRFLDWSFGHYLAIAPPEFAAAGPPPRARRADQLRVAA